MKIIYIFLVIGCLVSVMGETKVLWKTKGKFKWSAYCTVSTGQEIARFPAVKNCKERCLANPDCIFFETNGKDCVLKMQLQSLLHSLSSNWYTEVPDRHKRCGSVFMRLVPQPAPTSPKKGTFQWKYQCDFMDHNIEAREVKDHIECGEACFHNPNCTNFAYEELDSFNWCKLKHAKQIDEIEDSLAICGVVKSRIVGFVDDPQSLEMNKFLLC